MNALISMTFSGSVLLILYFPMRRILSRFFGAKWGYYLVLMVLLFFLVPVSALSFFLPAGGNSISLALEGEAVSGVKGLNPILTLYCTKGGSYFLQENLLWIIVIFLWTAGIIICVASNIREYWCLKKVLGFGVVPLEEGDAREVFERFKKELHIKREVTLGLSRWIHTPMTVGILKPVLLLPEVELTREQLEFVIAHELIHICHRHVVVKWIGVAANALHWFNPCIYILRAQINKCSEYDCDGTLVRDMDKEKRRRYGFTLLKFTGIAAISDKVASMFAGKSQKQMKERLEYIMRRKEITKRLTAVAAAIMFSVGLAGSAMAISCESPVTVNVASVDEWKAQREDGNVTKASFGCGEAGAVMTTASVEQADSALAVEQGIDKVFIDQDGKVYYPDGVTSRVICNHSYVTGTYSEHIKYKDGSCKVVYYAAKMCTKCDNIVITSTKPTSTVTYASCPH